MKKLTLVDLLVAMAIFSFIGFVGVNLVRIGANSHSTASDINTVTATGEEILKKIRYDVELCYVLSVTDGGNTAVMTTDNTFEPRQKITYSLENSNIFKSVSSGGTNTKYQLTDGGTIGNLIFSTENNYFDKYINIELHVYQESFGETNEVTFSTGFACKQ